MEFLYSELAISAVAAIGLFFARRDSRELYCAEHHGEHHTMTLLIVGDGEHWSVSTVFGAYGGSVYCEECNNVIESGPAHEKALEGISPSVYTMFLRARGSRNVRADK